MPTELLFPLLTWAVGTFVVFRPMILSGFRLMHGGLGDGRLVNYTLEHTYRWLTQIPPHQNFWDTPLYYPFPNVTAFTDVMLGLAPFYWIWRITGFLPDTSFQLWLLTVWSANFVLAYYLLRRCLHIGVVGASLGAYFFAYGNPQVGQWFHPQLPPKIWVLVAVIAVFSMFSELDDPSRARHRRLWISVFFAAAVLQFYSAVYVFFFFGLVAAATLAWALVLREPRGPLLQLSRQHALAIGIVVVLAALALLPLAQHYLLTIERIGTPHYHRENVTTPVGWLLTGPRSFAYGWMQARGGPFTDIRGPNQANGLGFATLAVVAFGLAAGWQRRAVRLVTLGTLTMVLCATMFGGFSLWQYVYAMVPGVSAIRAIGRVGMILALPASIGVAFAFDRLLGWQSKWRYALVVGLAAVVFAEQVQTPRWEDKYPVRDLIDGVAERVSPQCEAFLLVGTSPPGYRHVNNDAAWVEIATGIPTINGRYGNQPPNYRLRRFQMDREANKERLRLALDEWIDFYALDAAKICWVEYDGDPNSRSRRGRRVQRRRERESRSGQAP